MVFRQLWGAYDSLYRLTSVTFPGSRTVSYGYDDAGRRTSITYPRGSNQATYAYDAANELTSVTDWGSNSISYAYDDAGRLTSKTLPASTGVVSSYAYDTADRLTGITHVKDGSTTIASVSYTLDPVGNRTQRVDQAGTHTYAYDNLYRLTSVTYPGPSTTSYAFDAFGNRTSMTDSSGTTAYAYDDAERLTAVTPPTPAPVVNYTWDNNGDLTARGSDSFSWDFEDRMTSATVNGVTTTFTYRGDGLRDSRTTGGVTTGFSWDINRGLPVVLDDGNQYVYGAGLESMVTGSGTYYYLADGLGSTMAMVDSAGAVQKSYTYDVYGKPTATGSLANEFDFAGQQTDATGLQYLRARYMDPATGRFTSREPLAAGPSWMGNPHGYGNGNPARLTDPTGLIPWDCEPDCGTTTGPFLLPPDMWWEVDSNGAMQMCTLAWPQPRGPFSRECVKYVDSDRVYTLAEYFREVQAGCEVDPELCAYALGVNGTINIALLGAACSNPWTCALLYSARISGMAINGRNMSRLREVGRAELKRRRHNPDTVPQ